jgi:hypothetical protein
MRSYRGITCFLEERMKRGKGNILWAAKEYEAK